VRTTDLDGQAAHDVAAAFPAVLASPGGSWPTYRLPDGSMYAVAWRYLTPEEAPN